MFSSAFWLGWPMYESVKQNRNFGNPQFWQEWPELLQIPVPEESLPMFLTNKRHNALSFTLFEKNIAKPMCFRNF